jgi:hypothetical protein
MKWYLPALLAAGLAVSGAAVAQQKKDGVKKDSGKMAKSINVAMHAQNKSGESGRARLTPEGADKTKVEIMFKGAKGTQPAHIHEGTCAKLDPKPKQGLENVVDGKSTTTVPMGIDALTAGNLAINVHKSTDDIKTYVSCGDIRKAGAKSDKKSDKKGMDKKS